MKNKRLAIEINDRAFLPEAYAYQRFFNGLGLSCEILAKGDLKILDFDGVILFHGFHPFWRKYPKLIVGEYHSLSVGRFGRTKDLVKRLVNVRSDCYIFLNSQVRSKMFFRDADNTFLRGMGVSGNNGLLDYSEKKFDIIYCGSEREGVRRVIAKLASLGFCVAVVGFDWEGDNENIVSFGKIPQDDVPSVLSQADYGLNYTPDVHPLNIQDSTKILEYCSLGLKIITNKYSWVDRFEREKKARFLDVDKIATRKDVVEFDYITPDVSDLEWSEVIKKSGFHEFVLKNI